MLYFMSRGRALGVVAAVTLAAVALAGCGSGSSTTAIKNASTTAGALDPASQISSTVIAYADVTIKPQGSVKTDLVSSIDKLAGPGTADRLAQQFVSASSFKGFKALVGDHIGIALTAIPQGNLSGNALESDLLVVVPTASNSAAKKFIAENGPPKSGEVDRAVGRFAIAGGPAAMNSVVTDPKNSLAADPDYTSAIAQLDGDQVATVFIRAKALYDALGPVLANNPAEQQSFTTEAAKLSADSTFAIGVGVAQNTFRLDSVAHGFPKNSLESGPASDVGSLPGDSWLAIAFNFNSQLVKELTGELPAILQQEEAQAGGNGLGAAQSIGKDVISALGPLTLSAAGTSLGGIQAGLTLTPLNPAAGAHLLGILQQSLKGAPVVVSKAGNQIIVSFGYADPKELTSPSSKLSDNPTYKAALAQLPAGSHVPLYVNLSTVSAFSALDTNPSDASLWSAVRKLDYLIEGGTGEHTRVVLALK
jgi:hypothetical protein